LGKEFPLPGREFDNPSSAQMRYTKIHQMSKLHKDDPVQPLDPAATSASRGEIWTKIGITAASALLGGVAVALFNRKILQAIQQKLDHKPPPSNDDIY
jgi:hypothetical protein